MFQRSAVPNRVPSDDGFFAQLRKAFGLLAPSSSEHGPQYRRPEEPVPGAWGLLSGDDFSSRH